MASVTSLDEMVEECGIEQWFMMRSSYNPDVCIVRKLNVYGYVKERHHSEYDGQNMYTRRRV